MSITGLTFSLVLKYPFGIHVILYKRAVDVKDVTAPTHCVLERVLSLFTMVFRVRFFIFKKSAFKNKAAVERQNLKIYVK